MFPCLFYTSPSILFHFIKFYLFIFSFYVEKTLKYIKTHQEHIKIMKMMYLQVFHACSMHFPFIYYNFHSFSIYFHAFVCIVPAFFPGFSRNLINFGGLSSWLRKRSDISCFIEIFIVYTYNLLRVVMGFCQNCLVLKHYQPYFFSDAIVFSKTCCRHTNFLMRIWWYGSQPLVIH